jgi:hypothetical protein
MTYKQRAKLRRLSDNAIAAGRAFRDSTCRADSIEAKKLAMAWTKACALADAYNPQ